MISGRILHVSTRDSDWGAARAAHRIHAALVQYGADSRMRVLRCGTEDERVSAGTHPLTLAERLARSLRHRLSMRARRGWHADGPAYHPFPHETANGVAAEINSSQSDVVHLHWMADMLSIADIGRLTKPIVWTLHDMWAFCGGEICPEDVPNARFRQGYRADNRPADERGPDLNRLTWEAKRKAWERQQFTIVCPSRWLAACARESVLLAQMPIHVVPNPLDVNGVWQPIARATARAALQLPPDKKLILMGADGGLTDRLKGGDLLVAALSRLGWPRQGDVELVVFGQSQPRGEQAWPCHVHWLGTVRDDRVLALAYSAADVMVVPSRQDNLPSTAIEAQACGTPVVAFDVGGLKDIVIQRETGWLARPCDTADLAAGIRWVLEDTDRSRRLSQAAREMAVARFSPGVVAHSYGHIYDQALAIKR
jgi:glycosyltransferase involved in cell wall biosynthesis